MVAPVVGPFLKVDRRPGIVTDTQRGFKQSRPYNLATDYTRIKGVITSHVCRVNPFTPDESAPNATGPIPWRTIENRAYGKLKTLIADRASGGEFLGELSKSSNMVLQRALQLKRIVRAATKFDVSTLLYELKRVADPTRESWRTVRHIPESPLQKRLRDKRTREALDAHAKKKDAAGMLLEVNYGWVPLCEDISVALTTLITYQPKVRFKATAGSFVTDREVNQVVSSLNHLTVNKELSQGTAMCKLSMKVQVSNPNLFLLNQLGLLNPVATLWNLTPWSHVVDWFTGVGAVLDAATDYVGLTVTEPCVMYVYKSTYSKSLFVKDFGVVYNDYNTTGFGLYMDRRTGATVTPSIDPQWGIKSFRRAANAIAQLVQLLPKRRIGL